jgi:TolB-like protein/class 3 adenylate cyclase/Tfp pilus assembly protein PilF
LLRSEAVIACRGDGALTEVGPSPKAALYALIRRAETAILGGVSLTAERVERRLTAVLAADVAGYSRLMGTDEEGTLARLKALRKTLVDPAIASHRGRIVKTTGDGMLVEFASAVDAVRSAVEVQRSMAEEHAAVPQDQRIEFRIGIHVGDIIFDENDIFGDGVNVAARLEGIAEPGGICVSDDAHRQVRGKVGVEFTDLGDQELKNIALPIRAFAVIHHGRGGAKETGGKQPPIPPPLSIAVLPFANIGGDAEQEHFADGITESLTTDLSCIPGSFVIARNTASTFKGKAVDLKQVGRELNVRNVLEGSVQRGGNRLRLNVQLIDAATGKHLWAERFDKPVADLFDMQDEIVSRLTNSLRTQLIAADAQRSQHVQNPTSIDLHLQGWALLSTKTTPDAVLKARECFERALVLDPNNVDALVGRAAVHNLIGGTIMGEDGAPHFAAAEAAFTDALSRNPQHAIAHLGLGIVYNYTGRVVQGIAELERALALDRNLANAHGSIGQAKGFLGRDEEVEAHVNEALRLSPNDTFAFWWMNTVGFSKLRLDQFADATMWFRRAIENNRNFAWPHFGLASALVLMDDLEAARTSVRQAVALDPNINLSRLRAKLQPPANSTQSAKRERFLNSLFRAGMPEG